MRRHRDCSNTLRPRRRLHAVLWRRGLLRLIGHPSVGVASHSIAHDIARVPACPRQRPVARAGVDVQHAQCPHLGGAQQALARRPRAWAARLDAGLDLCAASACACTRALRVGAGTSRTAPAHGLAVCPAARALPGLVWRYHFAPGAVSISTARLPSHRLLDHCPWPMCPR